MLTRPIFALDQSRLIYYCEGLLTGCECDFLETLDFTWHFPLLKRLLHRVRMFPIGPFALCIPNAFSNLNTSLCDPQNTHLGSLKPQMPMLLCVEPGKLTGFLCPIRHLEKTGVGYGPLFCLSYTQALLTDVGFQKLSLQKCFSLKTLQTECTSSPQAAPGKQTIFSP